MKRAWISGITATGLLTLSWIAFGQEPAKWQNPELREPKARGSVAAPSVDDYYFYTPEEERVPEEFLVHRNLRGVTQGQLKGYHLPPILYKVEVLNRSVKAGDTVRFRALYDDPTGEIIFLSASFQGPVGRRTNVNARFRASAKNPLLLEGELKLSHWAEPGRYFNLEFHAGNRLGHSKGYFSDFHQTLSDVWFDVAPNPNTDVTPPVLTDLTLFDGKAAPRIKIGDLIQIKAKMTDERSGADTIKVAIESPSGKLSEVDLMKSMMEKDTFVGSVQLNPFYEGGEYKVLRVSIADKAGNDRFYFGASEEIIAKARFTVEPNDRADRSAPQLVNVTLDKDRAAFNEDVKIEAIVTDDISKVQHVTVFVQSPSILDKRRVQLRPKARPPITIVPRYDVTQNVFEGTFKVDPMDEPGIWTVSRVVATDFANNHLNILATEANKLATIGVTVAGGGSAPAATPSASPSAGTAAAPGKVRRIDMIAPHPIRGACINCHEP